MRLSCKGWFAASLAIGLVMPASAQNDARLDQIAPNAPTTMPATLTGKERLGPKWMDEQRIDNCKVPVDKRGSRARPADCLHVPAQ